MALYEIVWSDSPSSLVSAESVGSALRIVRSEFGEERIFDIDEIAEVRSDNFVLVRRCGRVYENLVKPSFRFCGDSTVRVFLVRRKDDSDQAVVVVEDIQELPGLLLWHFDYLDDEACSLGERVVESWEQNSCRFELLELDTASQGVLLAYEYCCCVPAEEFDALEDKGRS